MPHPSIRPTDKKSFLVILLGLFTLAPTAGALELAGEPICDTAECCPARFVPVEGTDGHDTLINSLPDRCLVLGDGNDRGLNNARGAGASLGGDGDDFLSGSQGANLLAGGAGRDRLVASGAEDELYGGAGNDQLLGGDGDDFLSGGRGNDQLNGQEGADEIHGNPGDDQIQGKEGNDLIFPGPGADVVQAGPGDDTVIINDVCELMDGGSLHGGAGRDRLIVPVPIEQARGLGVTIDSFEIVEVDDRRSRFSQCGACGCTFVAGTLRCCSGQGDCDRDAPDGGLQCACSGGSVGPDCGHNPSDLVYEPPDPRFCPPEDPTCSGNGHAFDEAIEFDLDDPDLDGLCDDLPLAESFGTFEGLVFHPSHPNGNWIGGTFPFVVFSHGAGHQFHYYDDLMTHLALNGIVAVTIESGYGTQVPQRSELIRCWYRFLRHKWSEKDRLTDRVAFVGHSRGGEAAALAGTLHNISDDPLDDVPGPTVVSLAPAGECNKEPTGCATFPGVQLLGARAFLSIQGTRDGDVPGFGLTLYDQADFEHLFLGDPQASITPYMLKSMIWVYRIAHNSWGGKQMSDSTPPSKGLAHTLARAYIGGFLRWQLRDEVQHRQYFTGESIPGCLVDPENCDYVFAPPEIFPQYGEGSGPNRPDGGRRRVIQGFAQGEFFSFYGPIDANVGLGSASVVDVETHNPPHSSFLRNFAVRVGGVANIVHHILPEWRPLIDRYSHISLRAGKVVAVDDPPCEAEIPGDLQFGVRLEDGSGNAHEVFISQYARVPTADVYFGTFKGLDGPSCNALEFFRTVRIPISEYAQNGVQMHDLARIELRFVMITAGNEIFGALADTIEFTSHNLDADCGNETVELPEECDGTNLYGATCVDLGFSGGVLACDNSCQYKTGGCIP